MEVSEDPDAWPPLDTLRATLLLQRRAARRHVRRPAARQQVPDQQGRALEMFVVQAGLALSAQRREQLSPARCGWGKALETLAFTVHRDLDSGCAPPPRRSRRRSTPQVTVRCPDTVDDPGRRARRLPRPAAAEPAAVQGVHAGLRRRRRGDAAALRGDREGSDDTEDEAVRCSPGPTWPPRTGPLPDLAGGRRQRGARLPGRAAHPRAAALRGRRARRRPRAGDGARPAGPGRARTPDRGRLVRELRTSTATRAS